MIISSPNDYRVSAKRKLPRFLFDYIDGGANTEQTLAKNVSDFGDILLRQRALSGISQVDLKTSLLGETLDLPVGLSPVGLTGMYARRGEVQAARAAETSGIPFTLSTVSICSIEEVSAHTNRPIWFQLYVLKDREFMKNSLQRALTAGVKNLVFTVDMPVPGPRYRDAHSGMSGPYSGPRRILQAMTHPKWAFSVGLRGRPHDLGNISEYREKRTNLADYIGWLGDNFDPSIGWSDLEWIRDFWPGNLILKGILDSEDVEDAIRLGADAIVVSNHGGRQLDGVPSSISALPGVVKTANGRTKIIIDSGIRSGLDVVRALCLGADAAMIGRSYVYALATGGENAVRHMLDLYEKEMRTTMTLIGARSIEELSLQHLMIK